MRRFTDADVYWSLYVIQTEGRISRSELSYKVCVGEGSIRKILSYLKEWDLITIKQSGISITEEGKDFMETIPMRPIDINLPKYVKGEKYQGVLVLGSASIITNGMRQRDVGIRAGAEGCTTFVIKNGHVIMSPDWDIDEKDPEAADIIRKAASPSEGDVILIGSGDDWASAMRAAVRASLDML